MTEAVANILKQVEHLSSEERALLRDTLNAHEINDVSNETRQMIRERVARLRSGETLTVPWEQVKEYVLARVNSKVFDK